MKKRGITGRRYGCLLWGLWIAIALCLCVTGFICRNRQREQQESYERLSRTVSLEQTELADYTLREGSASSLPEEFAGESQKIDFSKLQTYNPELIAWIRIPDTAVDYPVARHQGEDQGYYLHHDIYGETSFAGCIYMESVNSGDFSDYNTVLYGHNMKNGSMFASLHAYEDMEYMQSHPYIYIYLPEKCYRYTIFAAYSSDDTNLNAAFDFRNQESFASYTEHLKQDFSMDAVHREDVEITGDTRMITLSTCVGNQPGRRYLVQGIRTGDN